MRAVAERVQIKAGSLYYHFASKDEIIEEILNTGIVSLLAHVEERLGALSSTTSFAERISVAIDAHLACLVGGATSYLNVYEHLPPVLKRRSRAMRNRYAQLWFDLFADGARNGEIVPGLDLKLYVPYFLGGLNRVPEWLRQSRSRGSDVAALVTSTLLRGVLAGPSDRASKRSLKAA